MIHLWTTDIHLNLLKKENIIKWSKEINSYYSKFDSLIISGDISVAKDFESNIKDLSQSLGKQIYFIDGNHDYWGSSFEKKDKISKSFEDNILCLEDRIIKLNETTALVGIAGFYDGIYGEIETSSVVMNDWRRIEDFEYSTILEVAQKRSADQALKLLNTISKAQKQGYTKIIVITHFPPFLSLIKRDKQEIPYYGSAYMGNAILAAAETLEKVIVLCGHSHEKACYEEKNIVAFCGEATYGKPKISGIVNVDDFKVYPA